MQKIWVLPISPTSANRKNAGYLKRIFLYTRILIPRVFPPVSPLPLDITLWKLYFPNFIYVSNDYYFCKPFLVLLMFHHHRCLCCLAETVNRSPPPSVSTPPLCIRPFQMAGFIHHFGCGSSIFYPQLFSGPLVSPDCQKNCWWCVQKSSGFTDCK